MQVTQTASDSYSTQIQIELPTGQTLDLYISCTPEIGHDRYRLVQQASIGFRVLTEADHIITDRG